MNNEMKQIKLKINSIYEEQPDNSNDIFHADMSRRKNELKHRKEY